MAFGKKHGTDEVSHDRNPDPRSEERRVGKEGGRQRRRHTRLVSDWSSDVCSSDLCLIAHVSVPPDKTARRGKAFPRYLRNSLMARPLHSIRQIERSALWHLVRNTEQTRSRTIGIPIPDRKSVV